MPLCLGDSSCPPSPRSPSSQYTQKPICFYWDRNLSDSGPNFQCWQTEKTPPVFCCPWLQKYGSDSLMILHWSATWSVYWISYLAALWCHRTQPPWFPQQNDSALVWPLVRLDPQQNGPDLLHWLIFHWDPLLAMRTTHDPQFLWCLTGQPFVPMKIYTICFLPCKILLQRGRVLKGPKMDQFSLDSLLVCLQSISASPLWLAPVTPQTCPRTRNWSSLLLSWPAWFAADCASIMSPLQTWWHWLCPHMDRTQPFYWAPWQCYLPLLFLDRSWPKTSQLLTANPFFILLGNSLIKLSAVILEAHSIMLAIGSASRC